jgi:hypothetical protein
MMRQRRRRKVQNWEHWKIRPTPTPEAKEDDAAGFTEGLKDFSGSMRKAQDKLWEEYQLATLATTMTIVFIPLIICCLLCERTTPIKRKKRRKHMA